MANPQEVLWLLQAQSGDRDALVRLLQAIQLRLYRYLLSLVHDDHLATDLLQDVFVIVIQILHWLREPNAFHAWVYRIASREAFRTLKTKRGFAKCHEMDVPLDAVAAEASEDPAPEIIERIPELLEQVSPASRAVLSLHYLQEMTLQFNVGCFNSSVSSGCCGSLIRWPGIVHNLPKHSKTVRQPRLRRPNRDI